MTSGLYNVFPRFFFGVNQVCVYLARVFCYIVIKHNEVFNCDVIIITKLVEKSSKFLIDFAVLASAVRIFEAKLLKSVNYCVCRHIFPSLLQSMNCFCNINILSFLQALFTVIDSRYLILHK